MFASICHAAQADQYCHGIFCPSRYVASCVCDKYPRRRWLIGVGESCIRRRS